PNSHPPIKPPSTAPPINTRFQPPAFFQSYWKNSILPGIQAAQVWRKLEDTPNCLPPISSRMGTINPMSGPATYHGHGCCKNSVIRQSPVFKNMSASM